MIGFDEKEIFISKITWYIIFIILAILLIYYLVYVRNLESRECSFMEDMYSKINGNIRVRSEKREAIERKSN